MILLVAWVPVTLFVREPSERDAAAQADVAVVALRLNAPSRDELINALSDMLDLADAWAVGV